MEREIYVHKGKHMEEKRWICTCGSSNTDSRNFCYTCHTRRFPEVYEQKLVRICECGHIIDSHKILWGACAHCECTQYEEVEK